MIEPWTPGPWKWHDEGEAAMPGDDEAFDYHCLEGPDAQEVLGGVWHNDDTAGVFIHGPDARLISLAPEMAELLARIANTADYFTDIGKEAQDLLARARGEA